MHSILRSLRSNAIALTALFVALGGTSYAVSQLPANSVGGRQVKDASLGTKELSRSARRALRGRAGSAGPAGARGALGPAGVAGVAGQVGPQGPKGETGTVDTSGFYDKAAADARFLEKAGTAADAQQLGGEGAAEYARPRYVRNDQSSDDPNWVTVHPDVVGTVESRCSNASGDLQLRFRNGPKGSYVLREGTGGSDIHAPLPPQVNSTAPAVVGAGEQYLRYAVILPEDSADVASRRIMRIELIGHGGASGCRIRGWVTSVTETFPLID